MASWLEIGTAALTLLGVGGGGGGGGKEQQQSQGMAGLAPLQSQLKRMNKTSFRNDLQSLGTLPMPKGMTARELRQNTLGPYFQVFRKVAQRNTKGVGKMIASISDDSVLTASEQSDLLKTGTPTWSLDLVSRAKG